MLGSYLSKIYPSPLANDMKQDVLSFHGEALVKAVLSKANNAITVTNKNLKVLFQNDPVPHQDVARSQDDLGLVSRSVLPDGLDTRQFAVRSECRRPRADMGRPASPGRPISALSSTGVWPRTATGPRS